MIIGGGITIGNGISIKNDIPAPTALKLFWDFGNSASYPGSGTVITDLSGNGITGTVSGATYASGALTTGSSKYFYTPSTFNLPSTNWTVSIVSNTSATQPQYWATMWGDEAWGTSGYIAYQGSSGTLTYGNPGVAITYTGAIQGSNTAWDFTYDGTTINLYKNGVTTPISSGAMSSVSPSSAGIFFGARHVNGGGATPTDFSATSFYQIRVYNKALATTEVAANYATVKAAYPGLSLP